MNKLEILLTAKNATGPAFKSVGKELGDLQSRAAGLGAALTRIAPALAGAFSVTAIGSFVKRTIDGIDALNDLSDATGASIENISALEDIAARTGTSIDTVGAAVVKMNQALGNSKPGDDVARSLNAIGLEVEDLKRLDPAEALRQIAVALDGFADDGNKARLVQELFGKSVREVAPLLKDLATQTELVGTVTTEQAKAAEAFNIQLFNLQKNASDAARAITFELLPALNGYFQALSRLPKNVGILADGTRAMFDSETLKLAVSRVERLQEALNRNPGSALLSAQLADARKEADRLLAVALKSGDALRNMLPAPAPGAGGGRGFVNPDGVRPAIAALPQIGGGAGKSSPRAERPGPGYGPMGPFQLEPVTDELGDFIKKVEEARAADLAGIFGQSTAARIEAVAAQAQLLSEAFAQGDINITEFARGAEVLGQQFDALAPKVEQAAVEISTFTDEAARNIQDALGDTLQASLAGNFDNIGDLWKNMLTRMVAEAAAAQLNTYLFGAKGSGGGALGGLGDIFDFLVNGFSVSPRAAGGPITPGRAYLVGERGPEIVVPRTAGTVLPNGTGMAAAAPSFVVNVQGDASENTLRLIRGAMAQFEARQMMRSA